MEPADGEPEAVSRELFPYLHIPRVKYVYLTDEEKEQSKLLPILRNGDERYVEFPDTEVQKFVPHRLFSVSPL